MKRLIIILMSLAIIPFQLMLGTAQAQGPSIVLEPPTVAAGGTFTVAGSGFTGRSSTVQITLSTPTPVTATVNAGGAGTFTSQALQVPVNTPQGSYQVTAISSDGLLSAQALLQVYNATLTLSSNPVSAGGTETISGSGFPANTSGTITGTFNLGSGGQYTLNAAITTNSSGQFQAIQFTVPAGSTPGTYTLHVYMNGSTVAVAQANLTVTATAAITLNPATVPSGTLSNISVSGTQFGTNEYVTVTYNAQLSTGGTVTEQTTGTTDSNGNFTATNLPVPQSIVPGTYTVTASGQSGRSATATLTVTANPTVIIAPTSASAGSTITVSGSSWAANAQVTVTASLPLSNNTTYTLTATPYTDASGHFTTQLTLPASASAGNVTFTVTQVQNRGNVTQSAVLHIAALSPSLTVNPTSTIAGLSVTIGGQGFLPGPNAPVTLSAQVIENGFSQTLSQTVNPDSNGAFSAPLGIPGNAAAGLITVTASQAASGASATAQLNIVAATTPTPTSTPIPTATPSPTSTPTPSPTATATPVVIVPPTPHPTVKPRHPALAFQYASMLLHTIHPGEKDRVSTQASVHRVLGIWAHVLFPSGVHLDFYTNTQKNGHWSKVFTVPHNVRSPYTDHAYITLQLWRGKTTVKSFVSFVIAR